ncbi:exodeoxyribonuclease I, partial [Buchnera aphidicola (Hormaphis cornu)]
MYIEKTSNFIFYDYETFGKNPMIDKPAQFASIITDVNFNNIQNVVTFYCYPPNDYLPNPESVLITGITPQRTRLLGFNEAVFSRRIYDIFSSKNSCIIGYNNIQFDDEITRNIFYRNFLDPYSWSWKHGNSRWDLINVLIAYYVLRPEGIKWPLNQEGFVSFKLQDITKKNDIQNYRIHDAGSDVYATMELTKKIRKCHPKLFNFLFKYRIKTNILNLIVLNKNKPMLYISRFFGSIKNNFSIILCIKKHQYNNNVIIAYDLSKDVQDLVNYLISTNFKLLDKSILFKKGLLFIYLNKCPILVPFSMLRQKDLIRLRIDLNKYRINFIELKKNIAIFMKIQNSLVDFSYSCLSYDVDLQIYAGFLSAHDKLLASKVQTMDPFILSQIHTKLCFFDNRMKELLFRYRARNYPETLNNIEQKTWKNHCKNFLNDDYLKEYRLKLKEFMMVNAHN